MSWRPSLGYIHSKFQAIAWAIIGLPKKSKTNKPTESRFHTIKRNPR